MLKSANHWQMAAKIAALQLDGQPMNGAPGQ